MIHLYIVVNYNIYTCLFIVLNYKQAQQDTTFIHVRKKKKKKEKEERIELIKRLECASSFNSSETTTTTMTMGMILSPPSHATPLNV